MSEDDEMLSALILERKQKRKYLQEVLKIFGADFYEDDYFGEYEETEEEEKNNEKT